MDSHLSRPPAPFLLWSLWFLNAQKQCPHPSCSTANEQCCGQSCTPKVHAAFWDSCFACKGLKWQQLCEVLAMRSWMLLSFIFLWHIQQGLLLRPCRAFVTQLPLWNWQGEAWWTSLLWFMCCCIILFILVDGLSFIFLRQIPSGPDVLSALWHSEEFYNYSWHELNFWQCFCFLH